MQLLSFRDMEYWTYNWRKENGSQRMIEVSKDESFYMQEYCGCVYSLRDTNYLEREKFKTSDRDWKKILLTFRQKNH